MVTPEEALVWLADKFGLSEDGHIGANLRMVVVQTDKGEDRGVFIIDKQDKRWRFSEVLAAYKNDSTPAGRALVEDSRGAK